MPHQSTQTKLQKTIEEELGKFGVIYHQEPEGFGIKINDKIKGLINKILQTQTEEYRKRIEEMKKHFSIIITTSGKEAMSVQEWQMKGYNQALNDVLDILKETK